MKGNYELENIKAAHFTMAPKFLARTIFAQIIGQPDLGWEELRNLVN